jgi:hypothetical protein
VWVLAGGMTLGAAAGLGTIAAISGASGLIVQAVAFFTSPLLLGVVHTHLSRPVAQVTLVLGSMLLYAAYALVVFDRHTRRVSLVRLTAILTVHGACLIAWAGSILIAMIRAL